MTHKFEAELNKIVKAYASENHHEDLKQSIVRLFDLYEDRKLEDEIVDKSHISEHQTDIFMQIQEEK